MANNSATGGYLSPGDPLSPATDQTFDRQVQAILVGVTGIAPTLVRPRWQPTPPKQPEPHVDWCAVGVTEVTPEGTPFMRHISSGDGHDEMQVHERITLLCSFYGPASQHHAARLRDGLHVAQNREVMRAQGMGLLEVGRSIVTADLLNNQWVRRVDVEVRVRRQVDRTYPILNLLSAQGTIHAETHPTDFDTENA